MAARRFPLVDRYPVVLTEGAVIERLRRDPSLTLDPHLLNTGLIYSQTGRAAMDAPSAEAFHRPQALGLATAGVDYIMSATLPALSGAIGLARVLASLPVPCIIGVIIHTDGSILDGTPLAMAIQQIDGQVNPPPAFYMVNCVHPDSVVAGLGAQFTEKGLLRNRLRGIQANTSTKQPAELEGSDAVDTADPEPFADKVVNLHTRFGLNLLGGGCGTDHRHLAAIAKRLSASSGTPDET